MECKALEEREKTKKETRVKKEKVRMQAHLNDMIALTEETNSRACYTCWTHIFQVA